MSSNLSADQLQQLQQLGILPQKNSSLLPLLSISGITFISLGGLFLIKQKIDSTPLANPKGDSFNSPLPNQIQPTQVPKSIQHYLLTSQQYFTQAINLQSTSQTDAISNFNHAIEVASQAIVDFPNDYRGYQQRGSLYYSVLSSHPELLSNIIQDFKQALQKNPNLADTSRLLAKLFAQTGDLTNTITYLATAINIDPTRAQDFYDLAHLQQQSGDLTAALSTFNRLTPLLTDPAQIQTVNNEISSLQALLAQSPQPPARISAPPVSPTIQFSDSPNLLRAQSDTGLIIAAPETSPISQVKGVTDSNSLSGSATLKAGESSLVLTNSNLTPQSQIFLSVKSGGKNQNFYLKSRQDQTFTVGLDTPIGEDIQFSWWIIN